MKWRSPISAGLLFQRVDRLPYRPEPQGRLAQRDEVLKREAGDPPPLPVTDGVEPPDRIGCRGLAASVRLPSQRITPGRHTLECTDQEFLLPKSSPAQGICAYAAANDL